MCYHYTIPLCANDIIQDFWNLSSLFFAFSVSLILWAPKTAGCGKRLVSTSAFHFGTMRFHARPTHIGSVLFRCFGQFFCRMNRSKRVLWRRVNGVYQQGIISNVNHIVPDAGRNQNGVIAARFLLIPQIVFAASHPDQRVAAFNSEKLIHTRMPLQPDIAARGNPHQGHLQVLPRPQRGAEIGILLRQPVYIDDERLPAVIAQSRICSSAISHLSCSLLSAQSLASYHDMAAAGKCASGSGRDRKNEEANCIPVPACVGTGMQLASSNMLYLPQTVRRGR